MAKITTLVIYKDMSFNLIRESNGLKMYINEYRDYCIIVNDNNDVLFELKADCSQNLGSLQDAIKE